MALDPRRVLTFRAVAQAGSFSRAAEALALTQPAVSQQVAALERQLGTRLLDRGPGAGIAVTETGAVLLAHADAIAQRLEAADRQLAERLAGERVRLRLGAFSSAIGTLVPAAVAPLRGAEPDPGGGGGGGGVPEPHLVVEGVGGGMPGMAAEVARGTLHVAVCFQDAAAPAREHEGTRRHELGEEPMLAALPPRHRLARRRRIRLAELAGEVWTAPSRDGLVRNACIDAGF